MFSSTGKLRYSPQLNGNRSEKYWLVVDCDPAIGKYYRNLYLLENYNCRLLQRPSWEAHITVIRNEEPPLKELWGKYDGQNIEFKYRPIVRDNTLYFWLDVESPCLLNIREEMGLPRQPIYPLHLTIGNSVDLQSDEISL